MARSGFSILGLASLALWAAGASALEPRLVVSVPALHSLVAALTEGATEPVLLYPAGSAPAEPMDAFQKAELIAADTIVWAGPGLESDLAQTLVRMPALAGKSMPLANDIPLFVRDGYKGPAEDRQASRAFGFWTDPRLAAMAVRHLTPHLVRMDPDRQGLYLDNELALLARLRALETEIDSALGPGLALPASTLARVDPYFRHRFLDTATESAAADDHRRKVSTADPDDCAGAALPAGTGAPGPDYYFETMRRQAQALAACRDLSRPNGI